MYNLNYAPTTLGVKVEEKLYLGVREQKRLNTTCLNKPLLSVLVQRQFTLEVSFFNLDRKAGCTE
jgi:hypothetical protein